MTTALPTTSDGANDVGGLAKNNLQQKQVDGNSSPPLDADVLKVRRASGYGWERATTKRRKALEKQSNAHARRRRRFRRRFGCWWTKSLEKLFRGGRQDRI